MYRIFGCDLFSFFYMFNKSGLCGTSTFRSSSSEVFARTDTIERRMTMIVANTATDTTSFLSHGDHREQQQYCSFCTCKLCRLEL